MKVGWLQILTLFHASAIAAGRPDIHIDVVNECDFDVNVAWVDTVCGGGLPNVVYMKERIGKKGGSVSRFAQDVPHAGGRIYAFATDDTNMERGMDTDTFANFVKETQAVQCGKGKYDKYRVGGPEYVWSAFAELTYTNEKGKIINDADLSMVDSFYLPMSYDFMYSGGETFDTQFCHNSSISALPTETGCSAHGGAWKPVPQPLLEANAPYGYCQSPNILCQDPVHHAYCSEDLPRFKKLIDQLEHSYGDLQSAKAFSWVHPDNRTVFPGQVWTCQQFFNTAKFEMAEMCAAINRGMCEFSTLGSLSAEDFATWIANDCGSKQNYQPPDTWFIGGRDGRVHNKYAYWLRRELKGSVYSFSQDEGFYGGNANCNNLQGGHAAPDSTRITMCPKQTLPTPSPTPAPGPTPSPTPTPAPPPVPHVTTDSCSVLRCIGVGTNGIPVGEQWITIKREYRSGCCAFKIGLCDLCGKPSLDTSMLSEISV